MRSILSHPIIMLLFIVLAIVFFISLDQSDKRTKLSQAEITKLENEVSQAELDVQKLEEELKIAQHPVTREKVIRDQLLMQKENEYVFQLPEIQIEEKVVEVEKPPTPWEEWQQILFKF